MGRDRFHPGALLLLVVFSLQAVAPGVSGRLLLCIGCEGAGFAIAAAPFFSPPMAQDSCCPSWDHAEEGSAQERARPAECGCVFIALDRAELQIQLASAAPEAASLAAAEAGGSAAPTVSGLGQRGPPRGHALPIDQTPLAGRTCLLI